MPLPVTVKCMPGLCPFFHYAKKYLVVKIASVYLLPWYRSITGTLAEKPEILNV